MSGRLSPRLRRPHRPRRLLASPLLHFLVLGGGLYLLVPELRPTLWPTLRPTLLLAAPADERAIDDAVLFEEARGAGLLEGAVVENRLARVGAFVSQHPESGAADDAADDVARARALGLHESDVVIRRYVSELMRLEIAREADHPLPTEAELDAHRVAHAERFAQPEQLRFQHVFVSARRGPAGEEIATELLARLGDRGPDAGRMLGDPFPYGRSLFGGSPDLSRRLGPEFVARLPALAEGVWQGPVASTFGHHLVYLEERLPARLPPVAEIRGQLLHNLLRERRAAHLRRRLDELRSGYEIRIERAATAPPSANQGA